MSALRHIAVHVEEPRSGQFAWVLTERDGDDWQPLERARSTEHRYQDAMSKGLLALQKLVDDLDIGPRAIATTATETPASRGRGSTASPPHDDPPRKGAYFGFGPAR